MAGSGRLLYNVRCMQHLVGQTPHHPTNVIAALLPKCVPQTTNVLPINTGSKRHQMTAASVSLPSAKIGHSASIEEKREFIAVLPDIVRDLSEIGSHTDIADAQKAYAKSLHYNLRDGKMNRGLAVVLSYKLLAPSSELTKENMHRARLLGWCMELMQSFFLVADDIMDGSETRRGKLCWYRKDDLGLAAFNDAILLEAGIYKLLQKHFKSQPYYIDVLELFHNVSLKTALGQSCDLRSTPGSESPRLKKFTMDRYNSIVKYKTAHYSFYLPVALAMHLSGVTHRELHRQAHSILMEIGMFFQVQDDYLDCFGDPSVTGKIGTDIVEGKCTWLAVVALQRASTSQKAIMEEHYGINDKDSVDKIKKLYKELCVEKTYNAYEESTSALIRKHIHQISSGLNHNVFFKLLDKIYKRSV